MNNYQRYLREKKEVEIENLLVEKQSEEVEETRRMDKVNLSPSDRMRLGASPDSTGKIRTPTTKPLEPQNTTGKKNKEIAGWSTKSATTSNTSPTSTTTSTTTKSRPTVAKTPTSIDPSRISGETISDIVHSAGGSDSRMILGIIKGIIAKEKLDIKDSSFLR